MTMGHVPIVKVSEPSFVGIAVTKMSPEDEGKFAQLAVDGWADYKGDLEGAKAILS